jgi:hypothetical protein
MKLDYEHLKARQREVRDGFPSSLSLRTHRSLSWLQRAEMEKNDPDAQFLFLWIAFNAAYANEIHDRRSFSEKKMLLGFLGRLVDSDRERLLYNIVWSEFPKSIRLLLDNQYVYQPFWDFHNGRIDEAEWQSSFAKSKAAAHRAIGKMDTKRMLAVLLDRVQCPLWFFASICSSPATRSPVIASRF